jgi:hypothetical protein
MERVICEHHLYVAHGKDGCNTFAIASQCSIA